MPLWAMWVYCHWETGSLPYAAGPEGPRTHPCPRSQLCVESIGKRQECCRRVFPKGKTKKRSRGWDELILMTLDRLTNRSHLLNIIVKNSHKSRNARKSLSSQNNEYILRNMLLVALTHIPGRDDRSQRPFLPGWQPGHCSLSICNLRDLQGHTNTSQSISQTLGKAVVYLLVDATFNLT